MLSEKIQSLFVAALHEKFDCVTRIENEYDFAAGVFTVSVFSPMTGAKQVLFKSKDSDTATFTEDAYRKILEEDYLSEYQDYDVAEYIFEAWETQNAINNKKNDDEISIELFIKAKNIKFWYRAEPGVLSELDNLLKEHNDSAEFLAELNEYNADNVRMLNGVKHVRIPSTKSNVTAGVLAILFGGLGVHRFYLGQIGLGLLMFGITILCMFTGLFFVPFIWMVIDAVMLFMANKEEFARKHSVWTLADYVKVKDNETQMNFLNTK